MLKLFHSIAHLETFLRKKPSTVSRQDLLAYTLVYAWATHFPSQVEIQIFKLLNDTKEIATAEPDRFYKQRRIALSELVEYFRQTQNS